MARALLIAEAGVNHNGETELALRLVDAAAEAGADVVKFQSFRAERVISVRAEKAAYQKVTTGAGESQLEMVRKLELSEEAHHKVAAHCRARGIAFMSTPFDLQSVDLLVSLGVPRMKVPSGEITNAQLLDKVARTGLPAIVSTGMSTLGEVEGALAVLAAGYVGGGEPMSVLRSEAGQAALHDKVTLLHCTTEYPAPYHTVNLRAMKTLAKAFGLPVGYSDHTVGNHIAMAAIALGAVVIEKHFTLDRNLPGPDQRASIEPAELRALVEGVRAVEESLGSARKLPSPAELGNLAIARRSLVAACKIKRGESFTVENLTAKRPAGGISPMRFAEYLGRAAERDYEPDEPI